MAGVLAEFRNRSFRAVDHRWREADRIVTDQYSRQHLSSAESKRAAWHNDVHVRNIVRLMVLTGKWQRAPLVDSLRSGDIDYLQAIDVMVDVELERLRQTIECLLLGWASDQEIADHLDIPAEVVAICHDVFFDVRSRLSKFSLIQDIVLPPHCMQGGLKSPKDVERVVAYLTGAQVFMAFRLGYNNDAEVKRIHSALKESLVNNQTISALFRRSFGYESTEGIIEHMQQYMLVQARESARDTGGEDARHKRIRDGIEQIIAHNLGPEVVLQGDATFSSSMEREPVTITADSMQEALK